jgi:hypothetical protein
MKKTLLSLTAVAAVLSASAALADSQTLYVTQVGDFHHAETTQVGYLNEAIIMQNGGFNTMNILQSGTDNYLQNNQGYINGFAREYSSADETLVVLQTGDGNIGATMQAGNGNDAVLVQNGTGNEGNVFQNDNFSFNQLNQQGSGNFATSIQGVFTSWN